MGADGLLGIMKDYVPGYWKRVVNGMRFYAWYIAVSAGWTNYHTRDCAEIRGGYAEFRWSPAWKGGASCPRYGGPDADPEGGPMKPNTNLLMGVAEAIACVALAGICVSAAVDGDPIAWLFGFGSLTFAWDLWRRFGKTRGETNPTGQRGR